MEFKQLEAYVKVIELKSFSNAAEELFISQPSISAYITALEKELQVSLINRTTKTLSPTDAGKIFYSDAKDILALKNKSINKVKNFGNSTSGQISILASSVPAQYILPKMIADFNKIYPNIKVHLTQKDSSSVIKGILSQDAEVGFVGNEPDNDKCIFTPFMTERLVAIAPNEEQFRNLGKVNAVDLLNKYQFVSREKGSGTRAQYESYLKNCGANIKLMNECANFDNTQSIINAVSNGLGISIISEYAARLYCEQGLIIPLELATEPAVRNFHYVVKKNVVNSHLVDLFTNFIVEKIES